MAVVPVDAIQADGGYVDGPPKRSGTIDVTGANAVFVVSMHKYGDPVVSVKIGSNTFTLEGVYDATSLPNSITISYLVSAAAIATGVIDVLMSGASDVTWCAFSFSGVNEADPMGSVINDLGISAEGVGDSYVPSDFTGLTSGNWLIGCIGSNRGQTHLPSAAVGSGQTTLLSPMAPQSGDDGCQMLGSSKEVNATSEAYSFTWDSTGNGTFIWGAVVFEVLGGASASKVPVFQNHYRRRRG